MWQKLLKAIALLVVIVPPTAIAEGPEGPSTASKKKDAGTHTDQGKTTKASDAGTHAHETAVKRGRWYLVPDDRDFFPYQKYRGPFVREDHGPDYYRYRFYQAGDEAPSRGFRVPFKGDVKDREETSKAKDIERDERGEPKAE